jgi:hypothetical protein
MNDNIEPNCAGDVGVYPDHSIDDPLEPRSTADFINDVWVSRQSPCYAIRPKEVEVLLSKTARGWFWRLILGLVRYSRPSKFSVQTEAYDGAPGLAENGVVHNPESERTMKHYLALASKFTPNLLKIKPRKHITRKHSTRNHDRRAQRQDS